MSEFNPRLKPRTGDLSRAWHERVQGPLRGLPRCQQLPAVLADPALAGRPIQDDLEHIVHRVAGRELTPFVVGDHARWQSLTDFFARGAAQAERLLPYVQSGDAILEYGGGVGRQGRVIAQHVARLVSVDVDPLMKIYGGRLSPGVEFFDRDELPESEQFDGAYSVAVFFHLPLAQQKAALEYVHRRLKPGGWFLVDLKIGGGASRPDGDYGDVQPTALEDFRALYDPLFTAKRVSLFNSGFLLRKRDASAAAPAPADGRYAINEASIVADVLEGEVVVVNLDTGAYYILQGTASAIWQALAAGSSVPETADALARHYIGDRSAIETAVADFLKQLVDELLLVAASGQPTPPLDTGRWPGSGEPFQVPVMFRYTDMQALIQMDPIREYDETGWPVRRAAQPPPTNRE